MNSLVRLLIVWLINAVAVYVTATIVPGIYASNFTAVLITALVLGLLNAIVRPILVFFSFPLVAITLGLFLLVINALMLYATAYFVSGFRVDGFIPAVIGSLAISIISWILSTILSVKKGE
jgi:putative membrane protein